MINETKTPVASRKELSSGLQLLDSLISKLQEMREISTTILARLGEEEIEMSHREGTRMLTLRDEVGELFYNSGSQSSS